MELITSDSMLVPDLLGDADNGKPDPVKPAKTVEVAEDSYPRQNPNIDPSNESDVVRVAEEEGLSVSYVRDNFASVKGINHRRKQRQSLEDRPVTIELYDSPTETWASGDYDELGLIESTIRDVSQGWDVGTAITDLGDEGWGQIMGGPDSGYSERVASYRQTLQKGRTGETNWGTGIPGSVSETLPMMWDVSQYALAGGVALGGVGAVAGTALPGVGTIAGGITGGAWGLRVGAGVGTGKLEAGLAYDEYIQMSDASGKPMSHEAARGGALLVGAVNGALEVVGLERIARTIPGADKFLGSVTTKGLKQLLQHPSFQNAAANFGSKMVGGTLGEGAIEALQELVVLGGKLAIDIGSDVGVSEQDMPTLEEAVDVAGQAFYQGTQAGFAFSTPGSVAGAYMEAKATNDVAATQKALDVFNEVGPKMNSIEGHAPKVKAQFEKMVEAYDAGDTAYIELEQLETFFQEAGVTTEQLKEEAPAIYDALIEAKATGSLAAIPMGDYLTVLAPSKNVSSLKDFIKFDPESFTNNELTGFKEKIAELEKTIDEDATPETSVFQDINTQLIESGYSPDSARKMAVLWESVFESVGDKLPITPQEFFEQFTVQIQNEKAGGENLFTLEEGLSQFEQDMEGTAIWDAAVAKFGEEGMTQEARMERAREMGFDVESFHSTPENITAFNEAESDAAAAKDVEGYRPPYTRVGFHFGDTEAANKRDEDLAEQSGGEVRQSNVIPVRLRLGRSLRLDENRTGRWGPDDIFRAIMEKAEAGEIPEITDADIDAHYEDAFERNGEVYVDLYDIKDQREFIRNLLDEMGYQSITYKNEIEGNADSYIVFDPSNIRSVNAAFDPDAAASPNLLYQEAADVTAEVLTEAPTLDVQDLVGKKIFPIFADLTAAGTVYRGLDGVEVDPTELLGGPAFPLQAGFRDKGVAWAFRGKGTTTKAINKQGQADYVVVLAMAQDAHRSNSTVSKVMFDTFEGFIKAGHIKEDVLVSITGEIQKRNQFPRLEGFPGFDNKDAAIQFLDSLSFDERAEVVKVLESKRVQSMEGVPNLRRILNQLRQAEYGGVNQGDALMVLEFDTDNPKIDFEAEDVRPHPSFEQGVRGKVVGKFRQPISWEILFEPALRGKERKDWYITMDRAQPVVEVTQEMADRAAHVERLQTPTSALASMAAAVQGRWSNTTAPVNKGGVSPTEVQDALKASPAQATLTHYDAKTIKAGAKDGSLVFHRLAESEAYVGIKTGGMATEYQSYGLTEQQVAEWGVTDTDVGMVGVINNTQGAQGLGAAQVLKGIEEGVTVLDAYSVPSVKYPAGFLPKFYSEFGFEKVGEIPFNEDYLTDDIVAFWKENKWDESKGYPPIAVMKWRGKENERTNATAKLIAEAASGSGWSGINRTTKAAVSSLDRQGATVEDGGATDDTRATGNDRDSDGGFTSKLVQAAADLATLPADVAQLYGVTNESLTDTPLFQEGIKPRGLIQMNEARDFFQITLTGRANLSTFLHESGHFFLEMMHKAASVEGADQQLKTDLAVFRDWLGAAPGEALTRDHHEKFARGFEGYLMEGKAPNSKVAEAFDAFRGWLTRIYKSVSTVLQIEGVTLNDDVRAVMDRMVGVEQGFVQLEDDFPPMFDSAEAMGVSEEEYAAYTERHRKAMDEGQRRVERDVLADVARQKTQQYNERKKVLMAEAAEEIDNQPVYRVRNFLTGNWGEDNPNLAHIPKYLFGQKLDSQAVKDLMGSIPRRLNEMVSKDTALTPDEIAPLFGYTTGMEMLEDIANSPARGQAILNKVSTQLDAEFGDLIKDGKLESESLDALHNGKMTDFIESEMKNIGQKAGVPTQDQRRIAKYVAQKRVRSLPILSINRSRFLQGEKKSREKAAEAVAAGDFNLALNHKMQQMVAHYMYKEAAVAQKKSESIRKALVKYTKAPRQKALAKAGPRFLDAINTLLDGVELSKKTNKDITRRINLAKFMEREPEVHIPPELADMSKVKNYRQMSLGELESLRDTVDHLWSTAKLKNMLVTKQGRQKLRDAVNQMVADMQENAPGAKNTVDVKTAGKKNVPRWITASLVKPEFIAKWIDGETAGFAHSVIFQPFVDAQHARDDMAAAIGKEIDGLIKTLDRKRMAQDVVLMGMPMKRSAALSVALNMGNRGNLDKMLAGYSWDEGTLVREIQGILTAEEFKVIQGLWDTIDTLWPEIERVSMDSGNGRPPRVQASELKLDGLGITLKGGYYPIVYDPKSSHVFQHEKEMKSSIDPFERNLFAPGTSAGFKEARVEMKKPPKILLSMDVLSRHTAEVIHFITHYEAVTQVNKLLNDTAFVDQFKNSFGNEYHSAMKHWLKDIANGGAENTDATPFSSMSRHLRIGMSMAAMGGSISTILMQPFGLLTTADEIGSSWTAKGIVTAMNPAKYKDIIEMSGEIRYITKNMDREIADSLNKAFETNKYTRAMNPIKQFAFMGIAYMQRVVNVATFDGARRKAISEGKTHEESIAYAEAVVRMTQSGAGQKDVARVQAGNEYLKLVTPFYTYFSVLYNRYQDSMRELNVKNPMSWVKFSQRMWWLTFAPVLLESWMKDDWPEEDEDLWQWFAAKSVEYMATTVPIAREGVKLLTSDFAPNAVPAFSVLSDATYASASAGKLLFDGYEWGDLTVSQQKKMVETVGKLGHLPTKTPWRIYEATVNDDVEDPVRYILTGGGKNWD